MKNANNQQCKSQFREVFETIIIAAFILGSIAAYIGFVFDFTIMFACGSLAALVAPCYFMTPTDKHHNRQTKGGEQ